MCDAVAEFFTDKMARIYPGTSVEIELGEKVPRASSCSSVPGLLSAVETWTECMPLTVCPLAPGPVLLLLKSWERSRGPLLKHHLWLTRAGSNISGVERISSLTSAEEEFP